MTLQEKLEKLEKMAAMIRYAILTATTKAGSGHPTSSLSAVELMTVLLFSGIFRYRIDQPDHPNNDRLIFSKGHASPLLYALWLAAAAISEKEMYTYRQFGSRLEGHPTMRFPYTEAATGSLGQGLSIGVGMALNARYLDQLPYRTYVLLGDSEMSEGSQWEALQLAAHYELDNLIGILDVNRLGQRGETMYGHNLAAYEKRIAAFGWETIVVEDGHDMADLLLAYERAHEIGGRPVMVIARTIKGKGVPEMEDQNGFHGKPLGQEAYERAIQGLGQVDTAIRAEISPPEERTPLRLASGESGAIRYDKAQPVPTRKAYGNALARLAHRYPDLVALDAEVSNSTYAKLVQEACPDRFFEMYVAEQNMVGVALGLARRGKIPFVSTFAAFFTRAFDQIRMSRHSEANLKFAGSHAGVAIGQDGPSQMGLEDLAMFRTIPDSVVLYPADAVSTEHLVEEAVRHQGLVYLRTTRSATAILYDPAETFPIGGCKVLRQGSEDQVTVIGAGVTLHQALEAYENLKRQGVFIRVIDLYSVKPLDEAALKVAASQTRALLTVEDHYPEGGLGEAVASALSLAAVPVFRLAVRKRPQSGAPAELLAYEGIDAEAIVRAVHTILAT